ncbi:hypothetical protein BABINDRAFT_6913 [Babjeviella inositovora NRRL Y-12698]|uniref:hydroxyacylglutathione hydrolase n=1 Tax=Babjeviella inositovora NRRL Y-12698 TaxID=984486 RepID=A0A1E3QTQ6_9ASCO|nr:uncharacterized protein BABINDRAFT_6913 [Babjeviella inositovora NRRL Y-12698]ODQ81071.1 hypothetical protein BABINDRAFT_6913 [Babjeviella inositovora NRRL Y-12698]
MRWGSGDNYCYVLTDDKTKDSWIIDPAEPEEVLKPLEKLNVNLKAIVNTHHHYDHAGGNSKMLENYPLPLIAGKDSPKVSVTPKHREKMTLGDSLQITALHTPCHTQDSICYYVEDSQTGEQCVFTGDTLFTSGCGRFFEGTGEEMHQALNVVLGGLPDATVVYPGHEYTKSNVKFSKTVLPANSDLEILEIFAGNNEITTGQFTIKDEKSFNPFMRLDDPAVLKATGLKKGQSGDIMTQLRELKNNS